MTLKDDLLEEIVRYTELPAMREGDITLADYVERVGVKRDAAATRLQRLVDEGILETEMAKCPDGRNRRVYRRASKTEG